ncbi:Crp/Fnr family transcriptional regulator [Ectobacillus antri]|uniref:Crp/Fnr family transcriptional regulator n=1 Tax=Ectobacillus antri TaxID=2486280 RepID=A0ABT6H7E1_9BACI|nr:Crp/Fnr family transcriptional regulator [Ectobacillus antri]MDG4657342.1 Crp/Fnr family transcriptional regulator [Ectobacillus antri]MDG5754527.1 Crp/Fnr family transcriptional regulator [Ectobacillus antri]
MDKIHLLSKISIFHELPVEALQALDSLTLTKHVQKGDVFLSPDDNINTLYLLKKGQVRLYQLNAVGKQFTVDILGSGNVLSEASALSEQKNFLYAEAMTDTMLCVLSKHDFKKFMSNHPEVAFQFITLLTKRLNDVYIMSQKIALEDVKYRILYLLLRFAESPSDKEWAKIRYRLRHQDIATMIGATRETVSNTMSQLKKEHLIKSGMSLYIHTYKVHHLLETRGISS